MYLGCSLFHFSAERMIVMQFFHSTERQYIISEGCFDKPSEIDAWINADLIKAVFSIDGKCYVRTEKVLYLVDGFCSDANELLTSQFGF